MGAVIAVVLGVIAVCVYAYVCMFLVSMVTTPLVIFGTAGGVAVGVAVALVAAVMVFVGAREAPARTPAYVLTRCLKGRARDRFVRPDPAWPQYFTAQVRLDLELAGRLLAQVVGVAWARPTRWLRTNDPHHLAFTWPFLIPVPMALLGFTAGAGIGAAVVVLTVGALTLVAWTGGLVTVGALRALDRSWQWVFRARGSCPRCYEVSRIPAYRCSGTHPSSDRASGLDLHRDVRPGRSGVLWRRCSCGTRLPTTVLRAARAMQPCCPRCRVALHKGAGVQTDLRIPVFGAASAGKTHLIMAGLVSLVRAGERDAVEVGPGDEHSARVYEDYRQLVDAEGSAPKTDARALPVAVTLRTRRKRRSAMVHVFDAAGEALADRNQSSELVYFDHARSLIFVVDPFSIPEIRDRYADAFESLFGRANPAVGDPQSSYDATLERLNAHTVETGRQRLAFVVTKEDLLHGLPSERGVVDGAVPLRDWLVDRRLDNLVTAAERDFAEVRYFLVSARRLTGPKGADQPLRWLLEGTGVPVPPETADAPLPRQRAGAPVGDRGVV